MTSFVRSEDGHYGEIKNPSFNAVSYTWGRFTTHNGPALKIHNISWQVPCINPTHFAVSTFQDVLNRAAGLNGLVWVDIACIDQANLDIKMDEIGKQGDIFRLASQVYIWLASIERDFFQATIQALDHIADQIETLELVEHSNEYQDADEVDLIRTEIGGLTSALTILFGDPWFSSLWTLQEACLCEDAILLTKAGSSLTKVHRRSYILDKPSLLSHLIDDCQSIKTQGLPFVESSKELTSLLALIDRSGLSFIAPGMNNDSGSLLLYSAARYRSTTEPLDRIYGIMQAFGMTLGKSRTPDRDFTLAELEDQLGEGLNAMSVTTAQMHVHASPPTLGTAWRPSKSSLLPDVYYLARSIDSLGTITREVSERPRFAGKACSLTNLHVFWDEATASGEALYDKLGSRWQHYPVNIHLDAMTEPFRYDGIRPIQQVQTVLQPPNTCPCKSCLARPYQQKDGLIKFLSTMPIPEVNCLVLLLGMVVLLRWTRPTGDMAQSPKVSSSYSVSARMGLLVVKEPFGDHETWRRIGIVSWEAGYGTMKDVHESLWDPFQCYLS